ncbi:hypothetical protein COLO4_31932 [Corchorus olitorius]|uniref:Uncharacterized protein n=1 Tax=Corchorus olitorius TaxID=93759 RepID=A0A1R3H2U2_9ROSI|nr:hypothetical protein COLO4_31932 [Corchorus olitorius]
MDELSAFLSNHKAQHPPQHMIIIITSLGPCFPLPPFLSLSNTTREGHELNVLRGYTPLGASRRPSPLTDSSS